MSLYFKIIHFPSSSYYCLIFSHFLIIKSSIKLMKINYFYTRGDPKIKIIEKYMYKNYTIIKYTISIFN